MPRESKPHIHRGHWRTRIDGQEITLGPAGTVAQERTAKAEFCRLLAAKLRADIPGRPRTVAGAVVAWLALNDRPSYRAWLRPLLDFVSDSTDLRDVGTDFLIRYHVWLKGRTFQRAGRIINRETGERELLPPQHFKPETLRHAIRTAGAVLAWSHEAGWCALPKRPRLDAGIGRQSRDVPADRLTAALAELPERAGRAISFLAFTGARPCEVVRMTWADVRLDLGIVTISEHKTGGKTGQPKTLYLTEQAIAILSTMAPAPGLVFVNRDGQAYTVAGLRCILRRRGIPSLYALRHSFAQRASESGVPVDVLAKLLGHADTRMAGHYYEVRDKRAREAAAGIVLRMPAAVSA